MESLLIANEIVKTYYDYRALNNVSIEVPKGSIYGLLGPNGAGKTSLIRIINQIIYPNSGTIYFNGEPLQPSDVQHIGYLPEERGLYNRMKVGEQALYLAKLKGMSSFEAKKQLHYWFEKFEIRHWWDKKLHELSKGMAQKIQFIVTVMHKPKLLIFDEPFSGFDPVNASLIKDEILQLQQEGATIIFSTHRMESVEELCEYIALIDRSNKVLDGKLSAIKNEFKPNEFEVSIWQQERIDTGALATHFNILHQEYEIEEQQLQLRIKLNASQSANELLNEISALGSIRKFNEIIPTANEIFLKAIERNSDK
ncbi:ABC transporter ATP-binding protein [Urechidicola sp. KH5]